MVVNVTVTIIHNNKRVCLTGYIQLCNEVTDYNQIVSIKASNYKCTERGISYVCPFMSC